MENLKILQQQFFSALWQQDQEFINSIRSTDALSAAQRLAIYRDSMLEGMITALADTYPIVKKIVGENFFHNMAKQYICQTPSLSPDLGNYGATFAAFIAQFKSAAVLPYLADVANLEWHWYRVFHGYPNKPFAFAALEKVAAEEQYKIVFQLPKNSALIKSDYPILAIWRQQQETNNAPEDIPQQANQIFIWRHGIETRIVELSSEEWQFLQALSQQKILGALDDTFITLLPVFIQRGWIEDFYVNH